MHLQLPLSRLGRGGGCYCCYHPNPAHPFPNLDICGTTFLEVKSTMVGGLFFLQQNVIDYSPLFKELIGTNSLNNRD